MTITEREARSPLRRVLGNRWGRLVAIAKPDRSNVNKNGPFVRCQCDCGKIVERRLYPLRRGTVRSCGCYRSERAQKNCADIDLRRERPLKPVITNGGYVLIFYPEHPRAGSNGYVFEHTLVMEKIIGRYLVKSECVHHRNGVKNDNSPDNLELWDRAHPIGQRHSDKMKFYMSELLKKCDRKALFKFCSEVIK